MLEIIKNDENEIIGVCEYFIVDNLGHITDDGEYVFISEMEINPDARNDGAIRNFIRLIVPKTPNCKYGYFHRLEKYPKRPVRVYTRDQWLNLIK